MLNHKFTLRESILLILCAIVGLGIFYYEVAYKGFQDSLNRYNVENLENDVMIYQAKLAKMKQMETYVEEHKNDYYGEIALYNNLANEISELGRIFAGVNDLSISWSDPTLTDVTVRRIANISFTTTGYETVRSLINSLNNSTYRCLISDLAINADTNEVLNAEGDIKVTIRVTFFETVDENTNLDGLTIITE